MLKELGVGNWSVSEIRKHFLFLKEHGGRTFGMYNTVNENIMSRYANIKVNPAFYGKVEVHYLTDEEFKAGKPGYVLAPFITEHRTPTY